MELLCSNYVTECFGECVYALKEAIQSDFLFSLASSSGFDFALTKVLCETNRWWRFGSRWYRGSWWLMDD